MELILLTKSTFPLIGWIATILGLVMDVLFQFTSKFGITNIGLSIILFTVLINLLMWPLTVSQQKSSKMMSVMQPELQAIQKKYKGKTDQASMMRMQAETKAVYSKYGTSMSGSCLFLLIQMPILFALYQVVYHIPAYVPSLYQIFQNIAEPIMKQGNYIEVLNALAPKIKPSLQEGATLNAVIDFFYKFTPEQWAGLEKAYPMFSQTIADGAAEISRMNYFLGVNLSTPPFQGFVPNPAWIIPILSAGVQWYSAKLMTSKPKSRPGLQDDSENAMAQHMQTMNTMMPLMSLFFCFTLPAGIGIYWVASGVCRLVQQLIINRQLDCMDIDEIVKKNLEKANEKALREGKNPSQIKSNTDKLLRDVRRQEEAAEKEETAFRDKMTINAKRVADSTAYYNKNAKPGSLAAKANMVAMFDERQLEKKRGKAKKALEGINPETGEKTELKQETETQEKSNE